MVILSFGEVATEDFSRPPRWSNLMSATLEGATSAPLPDEGRSRLAAGALRVWAVAVVLACAVVIATAPRSAASIGSVLPFAAFQGGISYAANRIARRLRAGQGSGAGLLLVGAHTLIVMSICGIVGGGGLRFTAGWATIAAAVALIAVGITTFILLARVPRGA